MSTIAKARTSRKPAPTPRRKASRPAIRFATFDLNASTPDIDGVPIRIGDIVAEQTGTGAGGVVVAVAAGVVLIEYPHPGKHAPGFFFASADDTRRLGRSDTAAHMLVVAARSTRERIMKRVNTLTN